MRIIKRYSNRRLYDSELSRNVTHADLADMVKRGITLKVVDTASGNDVTLAVLGRVMLNETSSWKNMKLSKELLNEIISIGGDQSMSILKNTILASIGALNVTKEKAEKIIDDLIKRGDLDKSSRKKAVMELLTKAEKSTSGWGKKIEKEVTRAQKEVSKVVKDLKLSKQSDFKRLETKVNKMAKMLANIERKLDSM